jgi:ABC-type nitrate/sulfonate/bicarbonate transport system permease component
MATDGTNRLRSRSAVAIPRPAAVGSILAVLVGWQLFSLLFPAYQFPGLGALAGNVGAVVSGGTRFDPFVQFGATIARVAAGFAISVVLATLWGVLMGARSALGEYLSGPLFVLEQRVSCNVASR